MKILLEELIKEAKKVLEEKSFKGDNGLCFHFHLKLQFLPGYEANGRSDFEPFAYTIFYFYQSLTNCRFSLGEHGQLNLQRIYFLNWIINDFPCLQEEFQIFRGTIEVFNL